MRLEMKPAAAAIGPNKLTELELLRFSFRRAPVPIYVNALF
ncbi:hypothetical protein ACVWZ4_005750 [Bradyrhizobium sp. USDA 4472]